jgi:hypothetical protein
MVNARTPCDDGTRVSRILPVAVLGLALVACSGASGRDFARYYDYPQGNFVVSLPEANDVAVTQPQAVPGGPSILSGVVATPPEPSPSPQTGFGGQLAAQTETPDQTIYQALAVTSDGFATLDEMVLFFLTGDPSMDVVVDEEVRLDGHRARLLVADVNQGGTVTASIAAAFTLGRDGTGFLVAAVFPPETWDSERGDFLRVLESFRTRVPPGMGAFPVAAGA